MDKGKESGTVRLEDKRDISVGAMCLWAEGHRILSKQVNSLTPPEELDVDRSTTVLESIRKTAKNSPDKHLRRDAKEVLDSYVYHL